MKKLTIIFTIVFLGIFLVLALAQDKAGAQGRWDNKGGWNCPNCGNYMGPGYGGTGMGGMMGGYISQYVPEKLPVPKNQEWVQQLRNVLALEKLSFNQYTTDADKFNAYMPYHMVIPQEEDHVQAITRMFAAYGLPSDVKPSPVVESKSITEAYTNCIKMERELISRYEWLIKNAPDRDSAAVLNNILLQTRHHLVMFEHALSMGGTMGPGMMGGRGYGMMGPGYERGYGMGPGMMGPGYGRGSGMGPGMMGGGGMMGYGMGPGPQYPRLSKPLDKEGAKAEVENYLKNSRNPNLKTGRIRDKGNTYEIEIVTKSNALVDKIQVEKNTGSMKSVY